MKRNDINDNEYDELACFPTFQDPEDMSDTRDCHNFELSAASCACVMANSRKTAANSTARSFWNRLRS